MHILSSRRFKWSQPAIATFLADSHHQLAPIIRSGCLSVLVRFFADGSLSLVSLVNAKQHYL